MSAIENIVISMENATERRKHITKQFESKKLSFSFFNAYTYQSINQSINQSLNQSIKPILHNIEESKILTKGEKGCLISHFLLWNKCVDENLEYLTIFEDDVILGENAEVFLNQNEWLKTRFDFNDIFIIRLETFLQPVKLEKQTKISPFYSRNFDILKSTHWGTAGYIISQGAAKYVIEYLKNIPSDEIVAVDELIFNKLVDVDNYIVYQLNPAICIQELQANQSKSVLTSGLEKEREKRPKIRKKKTLKQRLTRIKENIIRALNRKKWKEQQRIKEMQGKEIVHFM